jgi:hypothetical protein
MARLPGRMAVAVVSAAAAVAAALGLAGPAYAGADTDRASGASPSRTAASQVARYRLAPAAPRLVVCTSDTKARIERLPDGPRALNEGLLRECSYRTVQAAVDAVSRRGTAIYVLPGRYHDQAVSVVGDTSPGCARCDLRLEGTGERPEDVVIEGGYTRDGDWAQRVGIHAEHANGLYLRNLTAQSFGGAGVEVVWTDGFVLDRVIGRRNGSYGLTAVAADHGVVADCTAAGNGAAGIATVPVTNVAGARPTVEVRRCRSYGNLVGYAGGDSVYVHDNDISGNAVGISADSRAWQGHGSFIANRVYGNNLNPYRDVWSGRCATPPQDRKRDLVCPSSAVPVGTGLLLAGGQQNTYAGNLVYGNWRSGASQLAYARGNRWMGNLMGFAPSGSVEPNGVDFSWDQTGDGNCWQDNASSWGGVRSTPQALPDCGHPSGAGTGVASWETMAACAAYVPATSSSPNGFKPVGCDWLATPPRPAPG